MKLALIGVDYKTAGIDIREQISLPESKIVALLTRLKETNNIEGAVLISTCNRTELYVSYQQRMSNEELVDIFCKEVGFTKMNSREHIYTKNNEAVITYLFELACGIHSMIFGDDQIAAQVGDAITLANEVHASDSVLNTLFRHAVTCAKKVKTSVTLKSVSPSVATQAVEILDDYLKKNKNSRVLVIGNGEIGRSVSKALVVAGCEVYMTLRTYKYKQNVVPRGCKVTEYEKRAELFPEVDIIISATKSPHHTVSYQVISECDKRPGYIMDLALPRDIDPRISEFKDVIYYDIDAIGNNALYDNTQEITIMKEIINCQLEKFKEWLMYRSLNNKQILEECRR